MRKTLGVLVVSAGILTGLLVLVAVVWPLPELLTRYPTAGLTAAERLKAVNDVRSTLIASLVGMAAIASLLLGLRTYRLSRSGQYTDRYSRAVDQLGSDQLSSRLGGVYALERLARDSVFDRQAVVDVLASLVRAAAPSTLADGEPRVAGDAQAAVSALGRSWMHKHTRCLDLHGSRLCQADMQGLDFRSASFAGADLSLALLQNADLRGADLKRADLRGAFTQGLDLRGAVLDETDLRGVPLDSVRLLPSASTSARLV
jgi:Pentapeptide repeats (8 copies)